MLFFFRGNRNEYTDWDRSPTAGDAYAMRDSMSASLSDGLTVAPLLRAVHLHASRSPHTYFYHYAQIYDEDDSDHHVSPLKSNILVT